MPRMLSRAAPLRLGAAALLMVWLGFHAGGFFPGQVALCVLAVLAALLLRVTLASRPFGGLTPGAAVAGGALAAYACWVLASAAWSHAPSRALIEFDRALLYLGILVLFASFAAREGDLGRLLAWTALALAVFCAAGLLTRLLPGTFPEPAGLMRERISYPLTYWNAMGIASALAVVLLVHLTASGRESGAIRVAAAALLPVAAVTLYFTFSRGAVVVLPLGLLLYVVLGQPRGLLTAIPAAVLPATFAVQRAYGADLLARADYDSSAAAAAQGRHLAWVVLGCIVVAAVLRGAALAIDRRVEAVRLPGRPARLRLAFAAAVIAVVVAAGLAVGAPQRARTAVHTFTQGRYATGIADLRDRFGSAVDNGRIANWRVDLDGLRAEPLHGEGAATYRLLWERLRPPPPVQVTDGHSLYLETLAELGVVGMVLLGVALLTILVGLARRIRGTERHAYAAGLAAAVVLLVHAGVDWDWEMPAVMLWLFAVGGVALAAPAGAPGRLRPPARLSRVLAGLALVLLALTPAAIAGSQGPLNRAEAAFEAGDCATAVDAALTSTGRMPVRPEPFGVLGWCDARAGQYQLAVSAMRAAQVRDPRNWRYAYGLAVVRAAGGLDPRPQIALARRLNPLEPIARRFAARVQRTSSPARWRRAARRAVIPFE